MFPYTIRLDLNNYDEAKIWLTSRKMFYLQDYDWMVEGKQYSFRFKDKQQALFFKLTYGGVI